MKILHILNTSEYSGAENVVISIIKSMPDGYDCIYVSPDGYIREVLERHNVKFIPFSTKRINFIELMKIVYKEKPDVIHAHDYTAGIISSLVCSKSHIINHLHNNSPWIKKRGINSLIYAISSRRFKKVLAVSDSVIDEYVYKGIIAKKAMVVGNPIDSNSIISKSEEARITVESDLMFLGRLTEQKQPLLFIDIVKNLVKLMPNLQVAIVGSGELNDSVSKYVVDSNLINNVTLYGFLSNPYGLLKNTKVLCLPSAWEGFGLVAVEGLTLGKPVVVSPVGGLVDIVNDSCGKHCTSVEEFVDEIYKLLVNDNYYQIKKQGAYNRSQETDNINEYMSLLIGVYQDLVRK